MPLVISADEIKKRLPNYSPNKAGLFHEKSAKLADQEFEEAVENTNFNEVILLCGGSASGKSEFLGTQLRGRKSVIFDGTLSSRKRANIKIRKAIREKKKLIIYGVIPDDLKRAFIAFLERERKFEDSHFYRTHSSSRKTLLWIASNYPEITLILIESSYSENRLLQFAEIKFDTRKELINYLTGIQKTKSDIIALLQYSI